MSTGITHPLYNGHQPTRHAVADYMYCQRCGMTLPNEVAPGVVIPACPAHWPSEPARLQPILCEACGVDRTGKHVCNAFAWAAETNRLLRTLISIAARGPAARQDLMKAQSPQPLAASFEGCFGPTTDLVENAATIAPEEGPVRSAIPRD